MQSEIPEDHWEKLIKLGKDSEFPIFSDEL